MPIGPPRSGGAPRPGLLEPPTQCQLVRGVFLVHRCSERAAALCVRCQRPACPSHLRVAPGAAPNEYWCTECAARVQRVTTSDDDFLRRDRRLGVSSSSSDSPSDGPWVGGGGQFSGGGASGSWEDAPAGAAGTPAVTDSSSGFGPLGAPSMDDAPFSAADFAAFDALATADAGTVSHDS